VEFIPSAWNKMLPPVGRRKTFDGDHWLTFRLRAREAKLRLFVLVCPTSDGGVRKRVVERLIKDKSEFGFAPFFKKKELTEEWTRIFSEEICVLPEDDEIDVDAVLEKVEKKLEEMLKQTAGLPKAIATLFG
jgi:hypothetical protein